MDLVDHEPVPHVQSFVNNPSELQASRVFKRRLRDSVEAEHEAVDLIDSEEALLFAKRARSSEGRQTPAGILLSTWSQRMKLDRDAVLGQSTQRPDEYNTSLDHFRLG